MSRTAQTHVAQSTFTARDVALLLALACMWGLSFLFIEVALEAVAPLWIVAARCTVGAVVLYGVLRVRGVRLPRGRRMWLDLTLLAALGNVAPWALLSTAQQFLPSGLVAVINALAPSSTLLIAVVVGLERLSVRRVAGLVIALCGTALAVSGDLGAPGRLLAVLTVMAATVCYGGGTVYAKRRVSGAHPPLAIAAGQVLMAAVLANLLAAIGAPFPDLGAVTPSIAGSLVALGVLGTGLAFLAFYTLIERVGATNAILVTYLIPVVALLAGALVLGEALTLVIVLGTALTITGIWLAQRQRTPTAIEDLQEVPR